MDVELRYARSGETSLAYCVLGNGPVDLVFIFGFVSHLELALEDPRLARFLRRLASFCRVIIFDKRGTGLSDRGVQVPTLDDYMGDISVVMDAADSERAWFLGVSEGGPSALMFCATYPERTEGLLLYGAGARVLEDVDYPGFPRDDLEDVVQYVVDQWGTGVGLNLWAPSVADDPHEIDWWARFQRISAGPSDVRALLRSYFLIDVRPILETIDRPTLILHRKGDAIAPVDHARYLRDHIAGARYVELDGSDHLFWTQDFDPILDEIEEFVTGVRRGPESRRKLATTVFTDIVGSTKRAAEFGDAAWTELLQRHQEMTRRTLARFGGREIDTTGDGFLAMFEGPTAAIRCADAIRSGALGLGIDIRAGLHTGEVEVMGERIGGIAVHLARRVVDLAGPGEIWVSETVPGLVVGSGADFADRGEYELKGVPGEHRLFSVEHV